MLPPSYGRESGRCGAVSASSPASENCRPLIQHRVASPTVWNTCVCVCVRARGQRVRVCIWTGVHAHIRVCGGGAYMCLCRCMRTTPADPALLLSRPPARPPVRLLSRQPSHPPCLSARPAPPTMSRQSAAEVSTSALSANAMGRASGLSFLQTIRQSPFICSFVCLFIYSCAQCACGSRGVSERPRSAPCSACLAATGCALAHAPAASLPASN